MKTPTHGEAFRLDGQVVLITGGGSGIGRETALLLAAQGARVAVTELPGRSHLGAKVVEEITAVGGEAMELSLDVRSTLTIDSALRQAARRFGRLDMLVNNAGTQLLKPALEIEEEEFDDVLDTNLKGTFFCCQAAASLMVEQGNGGAIVNVASQHGVVGNRLRAPYCASKAGVINLTRALAIEWAEHGIRVNAVSPTFVKTEANQSMFERPEVALQMERDLPLQTPATPWDVAAAICYLLCPAARMITGHNLLVDGGWTAR